MCTNKIHILSLGASLHMYIITHISSAVTCQDLEARYQRIITKYLTYSISSIFHIILSNIHYK
ncbi:hypothetical protein F4825DRAFT_424983 [Nemania diffusa]|nr:hypothetical protein F4825DRAFT_424983 [Nemania diffusa]